MRNLILVGVLRKIFKIQVCFVPRKSIFDLFGQKWPARMVTVKIYRVFDRIFGKDTVQKYPIEQIAEICHNYVLRITVYVCYVSTIASFSFDLNQII